MKKGPIKGTSKASGKKAGNLGRREFLKAGRKILPALAVLGFGLAAPLPARADCNTECSTGCGGVCLSGCSSECASGCGGVCLSGCSNSCVGTCKGTSVSP